ncbi:hypothetical protein ACE1SV_06830 [Streptomyces sp. E-15]
MTHFMPAATGFRIVAGRDADRPPAPRFAASGPTTELSERTDGVALWTTLLHLGAPDGAVARRGGKVTVLAGEIYNGAELRPLVTDDSPASDAELLLALFEVYDLHAFRLVNGRFAAFVLDGDRAVLATDHAGTVPLYATVAPGRVCAGTEAKALRNAGPGLLLPGSRPVAGLDGVHQVTAGSVLEVNVVSGAVRPHRTWTPPVHRRVMSESRAVDAVREALRRAVRARLGDGTPLVVISGGIDSSSVAALAADASPTKIDTVSMGTTESDEFPQARAVAEHLGSTHQEITIPTDRLIRRLPHAVGAAECGDPDIIEYLLPLTALYRELGGTGRRILTGYGADIPLGGMHRESRLPQLDSALAHDMDTFDGLNEMTPVLSGISGHWTTHPFWDRDVLDVLVPLEAGLKRRHGQDKWALRAAMCDVLPRETVLRPKLGVHEGSGTTSYFSRLLLDLEVPEQRVPAAKRQVTEEVFRAVVVDGRDPDEVDITDVVRRVAAARPAT